MYLLTHFEFTVFICLKVYCVNVFKSLLCYFVWKSIYNVDSVFEV